MSTTGQNSNNGQTGKQGNKAIFGQQAAGSYVAKPNYATAPNYAKQIIPSTLPASFGISHPTATQSPFGGNVASAPKLPATAVKPAVKAPNYTSILRPFS